MIRHDESGRGMNVGEDRKGMMNSCSDMQQVPETGRLNFTFACDWRFNDEECWNYGRAIHLTLGLLLF